MSKKTENNVAQEKLRAMSLESFVKMTEGSLLTSGLVKTAFDEKTKPHLVRRILQGANFSSDLEMKHQEEYIGLIERNMDQLRKSISYSEEKEDEARKQLEGVEAEFSKAKEAYEEAKAEFYRAKAKVEAAERATAYSRNAVAECEVVHQKELDRKEKMETTVLMHTSATLVQLERLSDYKVAVSYVDAPTLQKLGIVDEIFTEEDAQIVGIDTDDLSKLQKATTRDDVKSRIAYVRMVAWYMLNDIPYVLAYADKTIDDLLKYNGII